MQLFVVCCHESINEKYLSYTCKYYFVFEWWPKKLTGCIEVIFEKQVQALDQTIMKRCVNFVRQYHA